MSRRTAPWLAWSVWGFTLALLVFALLSPKTGKSGLVFLLPLATGVIAWSTVGAVVASRRPENLVGWILWAIGFQAGWRCSPVSTPPTRCCYTPVPSREVNWWVCFLPGSGFP